MLPGPLPRRRENPGKMFPASFRPPAGPSLPSCGRNGPEGRIRPFSGSGKGGQTRARNHLAVVSAMDNVNPLVRRVGALRRDAVAVNTTFGRNLFGEGEAQHRRVMGHTAGHPNVGAAIVVSLEPKSALGVAEAAGRLVRHPIEFSGGAMYHYARYPHYQSRTERRQEPRPAGSASARPAPATRSRRRRGRPGRRPRSWRGEPCANGLRCCSLPSSCS